MDEQELAEILEMTLDQLYPIGYKKHENIYRKFDNVLKKVIAKWTLERTRHINGKPNKLRAAQICGVNRNTYRTWLDK